MIMLSLANHLQGNMSRGIYSSITIGIPLIGLEKTKIGSYIIITILLPGRKMLPITIVGEIGYREK